jgi:hypothetical protein
MALRKFVILRSDRQIASRRTLVRVPAAALLAVSLCLGSLSAWAQQPTRLFNAQPLPAPPGATPDQPPPAFRPALAAPPAAPLDQTPPAQPARPAALSSTRSGRVFCDQNVVAQPADPASVPGRYRQFVGIFSDADWNPQTCAALIVETVANDGTATITYVFGPLGSSNRPAGGVLHGTGVIKEGALLFQNNDGSQYTFQPFYSDLVGKWTTPKGQTYEAVFKRAF